MDSKTQTLSLVHGCNVISKKLRYFWVTTGYLYKFHQEPPHRPRPLPILVLLLNCLQPILSIMSDFVAQLIVARVDKDWTVSNSVFITTLARMFGVYRIVVSVSFVIILLAEHGSMTNVIASGNIYVSVKEQSSFANTTFMFYMIKTIASNAAFLAVLSLYYTNSKSISIWWNFLAIFSMYIMFLINLLHNAPLIYTCYLGSALGKHVENFSKIHIDTMFDQFMKAIEKDDDSEELEDVRSLPLFDTYSMDSKEGVNQTSGCLSSSASGCITGLRTLWNLFVEALIASYNFIRNLTARLNMRKYPELPEMKMTKLSSTTNIQISETMRTANSHLIRVRLRRTQIMLSELRDLVSDINKTSSPIVLMYLAYETVLIILITTASIHAKVYRSIDILILPTISITLGLVMNVIYLCTCLDETPKQLKLLINKLFDFIIMNHRIQSTGRRSNRTAAQINSASSEVCCLSGSEYGAINETWSQFQYTRKLANTIQFTMGGILPITRRLVLSILGHILSAVFISIEIMSIVDTLNTSHGDGHHAKVATNATSSHTGNKDFHQVLHH